MRTIVIGSGLIGLTTAYFLRRQGHEVVVIDRQEGPGRETSFANGALLTPSMSAPWNTPGCWRMLLSSLGRSDAPLQLRLKSLPTLAGWGVGFLSNSNPVAFERNTLSNVRLALHSLKVMESLRQQTGIDYRGSAARGALKIFRSAAAMEVALTEAARLLPQGLSFRRLSRDAIVEVEPALGPIADQLIGGIYFGADETADAHEYCKTLTRLACEQGVEFLFKTTVTGLEVEAGRVVAVRTLKTRLMADHYVVAAGSYSTSLLWDAGVKLPVRPAKGYSVTVYPSGAPHVPGIPIIDDHHHAAIVPLDGRIRVAGTAEFAGYELSLQQSRISSLLKLLADVLPRTTFDPATAHPWCGLRAMSVDGVPIIGATRMPNLFVNTGHGHLGWTMAAGSAQLLSDLMSGNTPTIDPAQYDLKRFR